MEHTSDNCREYCDSGSGVYPDDAFEGLLVEHWPNAQLKYRGQFKKHGKRVGQHMCFYENGVLQELSYWNDGWVTGTAISFREDGSKEMERDFGEAGSRTRDWIERWYGYDGELWRVVVWSRNGVVAEWMSPLLRQIGDDIELDKIVDEAGKQVYPDE